MIPAPIPPQTAALFCASPRPGGNSQTAMEAFAQGVEAAGGETMPFMLRDFHVEPCIGCASCRCVTHGTCIFSGRDQSDVFFTALMTAPVLFFASPIYYYHLPAMFKAYIDRGQCHYLRRLEGDPELASLPERKAYAVLLAGRPEGRKLFDGSLLTLRYFLAPFNITLTDPLLIRGKDGPQELAQDQQTLDSIREYGRSAWQGSSGGLPS